jgi:hypothetical protein
MRQTKTSQWVRDEQNIRLDKWRKEVERQKQQNIAWAKEQEADCIFVEDEYISPANAEKQLGKVLNTIDFENKLKLLCSKLTFRFNPFNPQMKALYIQKLGEPEYLCAYHAGFMPEHSIVKTKTEMVWDPEQTKKPLKRSDLPKHEFVPGKGIVFEPGAPRPGWKKIKKPAGELKRGWRTVLIKLVLEGILTPNQVERTFGEPTSAFGKRAWAYRTGKKTGDNFALPW